VELAIIKIRTGCRIVHTRQPNLSTEPCNAFEFAAQV